MKKLTYKEYFNKVYGCLIGKTVIGTLGAPFEGIKMPLELKFSEEMINTMLPNDDLDLQVLWLDAVEQHGEDFTSYDLLKRFNERCPYDPGEYCVMRKNFRRGVYPPLSGKFSNDFYIEVLGCFFFFWSLNAKNPLTEPAPTRSRQSRISGWKIMISAIIPTLNISENRKNVASSPVSCAIRVKTEMVAMPISNAPALRLLIKRNARKISAASKNISIASKMPKFKNQVKIKYR